MSENYPDVATAAANILNLLTDTVTGTNQLSFAQPHGMLAGTAVVYTANGNNAISELVDGTTYFTLAGVDTQETDNYMKLAATIGGAAIEFASSQGAAGNKITIAGATVAVDGANLKITSDSTGSSSTITIKPESGTNAKALFGMPVATPVDGSNGAVETLTVIVDGTEVPVTLNTDITDLATAASDISIPGATIAVDLSPGSQGSLLGVSFTPFNFNGKQETLTVIVDNVEIPIILKTNNFGTLTNAATAITNAGTSAGTFTGDSFAAYNFNANPHELLRLTIDGAIVSVKLNKYFPDVATVAANMFNILTNQVTGMNELSFAKDHGILPGTAVVYNKNTGASITNLVDGTTYYVVAGCAITTSTTCQKMKLSATYNGNAIQFAANQGGAGNKITIAGATVAVVDGAYLKITSTSTGTNSNVAIRSDSEANAKALFGTGTSVRGTIAGEAMTVVVEGDYLKIKSLSLGTSSTVTIKGDSGNNALALFGTFDTTSVPGTNAAVGNFLRITSDSIGSTSSITIKSDSGSNALALFGTGASSGGASLATDVIDRVTIDNLDSGTPEYITPLCDDAVTIYSITNLHVLNQAKVSFQPGSTVGNQQRVVASIGMLHGDATGTLDVLDLSTVIIAGSGTHHTPNNYEVSSERIGPHENVVTSKTKYYMNDFLNTDNHLRVRAKGVLVTSPRLAINNNMDLEVHGHLSGVKSLVIGSQSTVTLKNTAHTDNNMANHFTFEDLIIEDGGELVTEEISSGTAGVAGTACLITGVNFTLGSVVTGTSTSTLRIMGGLNVTMNDMKITSKGKYFFIVDFFFIIVIFYSIET